MAWAILIISPKILKLAQSFDMGMASLSAKENMIIANSFDFAPYGSIMDIGGGIGGFLAEVLKKNLSSDGAVYELGYLKERVEAFLKEQDLLSRCKFIEGSFFEAIPENMDLYILKRILHDWDEKGMHQHIKELPESDAASVQTAHYRCRHA